MWSMLGRTAGVLLLILVPLAWGLGIEWLFERRRRRRPGGEEDGCP